jgi:hypothetical protein
MEVNMNTEKLSYTIVYGYSGDLDIDAIKNHISNLLDIHFEMRISDYLGSYYLYRGYFADLISIIENTDEYALNGFDRRYRFIISISLSQGRKRDKASKYSFLKKAFATKMELFQVILDKIPNE